ncbi:MAG: SCP2 sterol-binding domain-containing protein [Rhodocyclaceae bacterium]|nr:SCP2 sterol-binding domain-containing protein [Rhodocyclaceae bacterium]MBX3668127.1 SCP2 sterol-binding domain-containing protein [Rhodocyclaceae bacterium]
MAGSSPESSKPPETAPRAPFAATLAAGALNHLLDHNPGLRARLKPYAGKQVRLSCPPIQQNFCIADDGSVFTPADAQPDVHISLPPDAALHMALDAEAAMRRAQVEGDAALAEAFGFVLRNMRWDVAEDLSRVVGDVAAERIVRTGQEVLAWQRDLARRVADNATEYLAYEANLLVRPATLREWCEGVDDVRDAVARLEQRLQLLERKTGGA